MMRGSGSAGVCGGRILPRKQPTAAGKGGRLAVAYGLLTLVCALTGAAGSLPPVPALLENGGLGLSSVLRLEAGERRARLARVNPTALRPTAGERSLPLERIRLNLFPGTEHVGVFVRTDPAGDAGWLGQGLIQGIPNSHFLVCRQGDSLSATVHLPGRGNYRLVGSASGALRVSELNSTGLACVLCRPEATEAAGVAEALVDVPGHSLEPLLAPSTGAVSLVDLMVVYTAQARAAIGDPDTMGSLIQLAVAEANTVFQNSRAEVRLRLVHTGEVSYEETPSHSTNLARLRLTNDGAMDEVHAWRDTNRADLVCLITEQGDPDYSGLSLILPATNASSKPYGFCVVKRSAAVGSCVLAHEISHNFGCQHDREHALDATGSLVSGIFPHAYGYRFTVDGVLYRTIMAYPPGEVVPFLSTPYLLYQGVPMGVAKTSTNNAADNVSTVNTTAPIVSAYYGPAVQTTLPQISWLAPSDGAVFAEGTVISLSLQANDSDGRVRQVEIYDGYELLTVVENPGASTVGFSWTNAAPGQHQIVARAVDDAGASSSTLSLVLSVRPRNDDFVGRIGLASGSPTATGSNRSATWEAGEPPKGGKHGKQSVWFSWTAPKQGSVTLSLQGAGFVPQADVYIGSTLGSLASKMKSRESDAYASTSVIGFDAVAGQTYQIAVGSQSGSEGDFSLRLDFLATPENDSCAAAITLSGSILERADSNVGSTAEPGEPQHAGNPGGTSVWYRWTAPATSAVRAVVTGQGIIFLLDAYQGAAVDALVAVPNRVLDFDNSAHRTTLTFGAREGQTYLLAVDGYQGYSGAFELTLESLAAPANDSFAGRISLAGCEAALSASNVAATEEPGEPQHAGNPGGKSLWYSWAAPVSGPVRVRVTDTAPNVITLPDVYQGTSLESLNRVSRSLVLDSDGASELRFEAILGQNYNLVVDGFAGVGGEFTFRLETENQPASADAGSLTFHSQGAFQFEIRGTPGQGFKVETTSDFVVWTELLAGVLDQKILRFSDPSDPALPARFYRVIPQP